MSGDYSEILGLGVSQSMFANAGLLNCRSHVKEVHETNFHVWNFYDIIII